MHIEHEVEFATETIDLTGDLIYLALWPPDHLDVVQEHHHLIYRLTWGILKLLCDNLDLFLYAGHPGHKILDLICLQHLNQPPHMLTQLLLQWPTLQQEKSEVIGIKYVLLYLPVLLPECEYLFTEYLPVNL